MAKKFSTTQWSKVNARLDSDEKAFGYPERRDKSVVMASFNIRKLGNPKNKSEGARDFLAAFVERCDLVAIQEVMDDLSALNDLKTRVNALSGDKYGMVVSDVTGWNVPKNNGLKERLAFLYRKDRIERTEVASDITIDRSSVIETLFENRKAFNDAFESYRDKLTVAQMKHIDALAEWEEEDKATRGDKPGLNKPPFVLPHFLTFIRTPHCVSFQVRGKKKNTTSYEFLAVNAHLLYGDEHKQAEERRMEFIGLMNWLSKRAKNVKRLYHKDLILFGDLNLDFDDPINDRNAIDAELKGLNEGRLKDTGVRVNLPFLSAHPTRAQETDINKKYFRTNARKNQTYDQIAFFSHDKSLPTYDKNETAGNKVDTFDYGMFDFTELFSQAIEGKPFGELTKTKRKALMEKFQHDVSDHMPIWVRLPLL